MQFLPPEYVVVLVFFLAYNAGVIGALAYLMKENRELKESNRESTKLLRDVVRAQEWVIRSDQPLDDRPSFTAFANDEPNTASSSPTP